MKDTFAPRHSDPALAARIAEVAQQFEAVLANVSRVILGMDEVVRKVLTAMTARGHVLLLDVPGTGKTMLARSLAASLGGTFRRVQFTPDLLPMDITGSSVFNMRSKAFEFSPGPVFTNLLLADEINRATPKTQSALLEVMAEGQVTVDGTTTPLDRPFQVIATMNPLDHDGTYVLPAAQLDRFAVQLSMGFPSAAAEKQILDTHLGVRSPVDDLQPVLAREAFVGWQDTVERVFVAEPVKDYVVRFVQGLRAEARVLSPPSPRATLMLVRTAQARAMLAGRDHLLPGDLQAVVVDVLAHRMIVSGSESPHSLLRERLAQVDLRA